MHDVRGARRLEVEESALYRESTLFDQLRDDAHEHHGHSVQQRLL